MTAKFKVVDLPPEPTCGPALIMQCAADVTPQQVEWLWLGRVALGKLTLIAGEAGLGKSQLSIAMAAAVTTGGSWPCDEGQAPIGNIIILSAEDDAADTIIPRLMAANANCERVHLVRAVRSEDGLGRRAFNLQADLDLLERNLSEIGDVRLIVIDPISSYLGPKVDSHVNAAVRGVLEPVSEMAARHRVAIVAITHPPKGTGTTAINRFIGSIAFVAAARAAFMVTRDADDDDTRRLFLPVKNNLAPLGKGLAFRLEQRLVADGIVGSSVVWEAEPVTITADQALQATDAQSTGKGSAGAEAEELLRNALATGPVAMKDIQAEAKEAGLSWATVRRAKERLGIVAERESHGRDGGGRWTWAMPLSARCSSPLQDAHPLEVSTLQKNEHLAAVDEVPAPPTAAPDYPELPACLRRAPKETSGRAPALGPPSGRPAIAPAERKQLAEILKAEGKSDRAIGRALGVDGKTIAADLGSAENSAKTAENSAPDDPDEATLQKAAELEALDRLPPDDPVMVGRRKEFMREASVALTYGQVYDGPVDPHVIKLCTAVRDTWAELVRELKNRGGQNGQKD